MEKEPGPGTMHDRLAAHLLRVREKHDNNTDGELQETDNLTPPDENCTHFWKIDPPKGPTSHGRCKCCKGEKIFSNSGFTTISEEDLKLLSGRRRISYGSRDPGNTFDDPDRVVFD